MESNGNRRAKDERSEDSAKSQDEHPTSTTAASTVTTTTTANNAHTPEAHQKSPRKRRKVNHGMLCSSASTWSTKSPNQTIRHLPPWLFHNPGRHPHVPTYNFLYLMSYSWANFGVCTRSYSLCVLSSICKSSIIAIFAIYWLLVCTDLHVRARKSRHQRKRNSPLPGFTSPVRDASFSLVIAFTLSWALLLRCVSCIWLRLGYLANSCCPRAFSI